MKISKSKQWMRDHPTDEPCPADPRDARDWQIARGITLGPWGATRTKRQADDQKRYEAAMAETRARSGLRPS
jgi:hypothetical protein